MLFDDAFMTVPYTVTFLIAIFLPGWRSIAGATVVAIVLAGLAWTNIGGRAGWGEMILVITALLGLTSGTIARALSLGMAPYTSRPLRALLIVVTC